MEEKPIECFTEITAMGNDLMLIPQGTLRSHGLILRIVHLSNHTLPSSNRFLFVEGGIFPTRSGCSCI